MDAADPTTLIRLLLDPCLTLDEARREAAATPRRAEHTDPHPRRDWRDRPEAQA
ncbi:MAG TPA: hypothetical protein VD866_22520 [Urbifossiella sp.]|nr:hypothetical protein [Urbifossiella sp.]